MNRGDEPTTTLQNTRVRARPIPEKRYSRVKLGVKAELGLGSPRELSSSDSQPEDAEEERGEQEEEEQ